MLLNSTEVAKHIRESEFSKRTQIGIDLSVCKIQKIKVGSFVYKNGTDIDPKGYEELETTNVNGKKGWLLESGVYSVTFNEGVKIPEDAAAIITHRSSLYRTGTSINSPWWDPGFQCENMNTTMVVKNMIFIEENARVAQIAFWKCNKPSELYNGQFQNLSTAHK